jgi:hypothetical protein
MKEYGSPSITGIQYVASFGSSKLMATFTAASGVQFYALKVSLRLGSVFLVSRLQRVTDHNSRTLSGSYRKTNLVVDSGVLLVGDVDREVTIPRNGRHLQQDRPAGEIDHRLAVEMIEGGRHHRIGRSTGSVQDRRNGAIGAAGATKVNKRVLTSRAVGICAAVGTNGSAQFI